MRRVERPDLAEDLLKTAMEEDRKNYKSVGNAVTTLKALTLCLRAEWYRKQAGAEAGQEELDTTSRLRISLGTAFGRFVNDNEKRHELVTPYGVVSGRTDFLAMDEQGQTIPAELKVTWSRSGFPVSSQYVEQLASYARAMNVTKGRLYIAHMAGAWGFKIRPDFECHEYEWTHEELATWYQELVRRTGAVMGLVLPSFADHMTWECGTCQFNTKNGGSCAAEDGKAAGWFMEETAANA